jgi:hypothetical protein
MVSTRTQTGTVAKKDYSPPSLSLRTTIPTAMKSPKAARRKPQSPTTSKAKSPITTRTPKPAIAKKTQGPKIKHNPNPETPKHIPETPRPIPETLKRTFSPLNLSPEDTALIKQKQLKHLQTEMEDICEGINFFPERAWGEKEEGGKSVLQRAERDVEIWEEVRRSHEAGG